MPDNRTDEQKWNDFVELCKWPKESMERLAKPVDTAPAHAFKVGQSVQTHRFEGGPGFEPEMVPLVGKIGKITRINDEGEILVHGWLWPPSALEPVTDDYQQSLDVALNRVQALEAKLKEVESVRDAEIERLEHRVIVERERGDELLAERDSYAREIQALKDVNVSTGNELADVRAERDALQAKINAGVRVWGLYVDRVDAWRPELRDDHTHTAILINPQSIEDYETGQEERKGPADRRVRKLWDSPLDGDCHRTSLKSLNPTIEAARSNCRRRNPGTMADRKPAFQEKRKCERRDPTRIDCRKNAYGIRYNHYDMRHPTGANDRRKG